MVVSAPILGPYLLGAFGERQTLNEIFDVVALLD